MRDLKKIDLFINEIEKASLILLEALNLDFFDSLIRAGNDLLHGINSQGLDDKTVLEISSIYEKLKASSFINEEIRLAMQLLIIKAFKHRMRYPLSLMTPDSVNYLFAYIIEKLSKETQSIMDLALGTANLITAVANYLSYSVDLIAVENDPDLVKLAKLNADLQGNQIKIYLNDCRDTFYEKVDFVIADLDTKSEEYYFPYQVILKAMALLKPKGYFLFLIDNDFFNQKHINDFKEKFEGTMLGIIILPDSLFRNNLIGKSILIGTKENLQFLDMMVLSLPAIKDKEKLNNSIEQLDQWLNKMKGMIL